jgi:hypothetical protein
MAHEKSRRRVVRTGRVPATKPRSRSDEMSEIETLRAKFYPLGSVALNCLRREIPRNARLAYKVLEAIGAFPDPREEPPTVIQQPTAAEIKEAKIRAHFAKIAEEIYTRSRAFDASLVDIEADLHTGEGKSNGTAGSNQQCGTENDTPSSVVRRSILDSRDED